MEVTVDNDHAQHRLCIGAGQRTEIELAPAGRLQVARRNAAQPLLDIYPPAGKLPVEPGGSNTEILEEGADRIAGARFRPEIHFAVEAFGEVAQQLVRLEPCDFRYGALGDTGQAPQNP